ncbi:MAG: type 1 glutamine amidotransferase domain-containing protein [Bdellovibrionota bacterium]
MFKSDKKLRDKKVAIIATHGFEFSELFEPKKALEEAGARVEILSREAGSIKSWKDNNWGESLAVDKVITDAHPSDYDAVVLPGGVINADTLRACRDTKMFMEEFVRTGKPIAAICHAPWILIEAGCVDGRRLTSYKSLKSDLINAGAYWADEEVIVDNGLVTSRTPKDLPAFNKKMIEEFAEGRNAEAAQRAEIDQAVKPKSDTDVETYYNSQNSIW